MNSIIFIYSDGFKQEFPNNGKHTIFKGIMHNGERPIKALIHVSLQEFPEVIYKNISYCLHPTKGKILFYSSREELDAVQLFN